MVFAGGAALLGMQSCAQPPDAQALAGTLGQHPLRDLTRGWLFINIWHDAQYLSCQSRISSHIYADLPGALVRVYLRPGQTPEALARWPRLPLLLVCHVAVDFQRHLVDAVIWRSRARPRP